MLDTLEADTSDGSGADAGTGAGAGCWWWWYRPMLYCGCGCWLLRPVCGVGQYPAPDLSDTRWPPPQHNWERNANARLKKNRAELQLHSMMLDEETAVERRRNK